jgi:hypothetical protein
MIQDQTICGLDNLMVLAIFYFRCASSLVNLCLVTYTAGSLWTHSWAVLINLLLYHSDDQGTEIMLLEKEYKLQLEACSCVWLSHEDGKHEFPYELGQVMSFARTTGPRGRFYNVLI